jgi:hypothetical protein
MKKLCPKSPMKHALNLVRGNPAVQTRSVPRNI